jgi:LemA protein
MNLMLWVSLGILVLLVIVCIAIFNNLITLKNRFKNSFAQISVQLQRRYDLIPNLLETAKKYMQYEQETLNKVISARNSAVAANKAAEANPADGANIKALGIAEQGLSNSLGGFFALYENYPDLKANQTMQQLMEELTSTENKISFARQAYNDAVMFYNTAREQFPNSIIANSFNFTPAELLEVDDEAAKKVVKVSFE